MSPNGRAVERHLPVHRAPHPVDSFSGVEVQRAYRQPSRVAIILGEALGVAGNWLIDKDERYGEQLMEFGHAALGKLVDTVGDITYRIDMKVGRGRHE